MGKGEKAGVHHSPGVEPRHHGLHQPSANATVPEVRMDCQWPEKSHTTPAGGKICTDQRPIHLGSESRRGIRMPARPGVIQIGPELLWLGNTEERPEGETNEPVSRRKITLCQRTKGYLHMFPPRLSAVRICLGMGCTPATPGEI
jgi:hypothetical protein